MADFANRLPVEVWLNIFDQIQDKQQLIQCKLVCKRWTSLVDKALLKTVVWTSKNKIQLLNYVHNHPKLVRYIQFINITEYTAEDIVFISMFLMDAMTPSLREIRGSVWTYDFIEAIAEVASLKPADSLKLEKIPGTGLDNDGYVNLVYLVRKTLKFLHLGLVRDTTQEHITKICGNLHEFESLTKLSLVDLKKYIDSIPKLDEILRGCVHLQSLFMMVDQSSTRRPTNNLDTWLSQNVQKVNSLKSLTLQTAGIGSRGGDNEDLSSGFNVDLLRYLSFKYPNVQHVTLDSYQQKNQPIVQSIFENAETVTLKEWEIDTIDHAEEIIDMWKSQSNSIAIEYITNIRRDTDYACQINVHKVKETNHTKFTLTDISWEVPLERIQQLVSSLGNTLTEGLEIDMGNYQYSRMLERYDVTSLVILQSTPFIQHLKIKSNNLNHDLSLAPLTRLHTLELEEVPLTSENISQIGLWAPHLKHLNLMSCKFTEGDRSQTQTMDHEISVPELALSSLTIKGKDMRSRDMYIALIKTASQSQIWYTAPTRPLIQTTFEDSDMYFSETAALIIECESLKHLSVSLDDINVELEFDERGNVTKSDPNIIYSEASNLIGENAWLKSEMQALEAKYEQAKKYLTEAQIQAIDKQEGN